MLQEQECERPARSQNKKYGLAKRELGEELYHKHHLSSADAMKAEQESWLQTGDLITPDLPR